MREICTYGSMRGRAYPTRGVPLYSTIAYLAENIKRTGGFLTIYDLMGRHYLTRLYVGGSLALRLVSLSGKTPAHRSPSARLAVLIVCRFLYDIAPSAISSAELCLAYLCQ